MDDLGDGPPPVLLIDEIDRADDEFEAFLLEVLADAAVTIAGFDTVAGEAMAVGERTPVALLDAADQAHIAGFVVNKFRGAPELLHPLSMT